MILLEVTLLRDCGADDECWQGGQWGDRHGDWQVDWYGDGDDVRGNDVGAGQCPVDMEVDKVVQPGD